MSGEKRKNYIDMFYEPDFSTYDFIFLFSAMSILEEQNCFNKGHLIAFIRICKSENKYRNILNDINFKNNGLFDYSEDINEAIAKLKWVKILYTIFPETDATVYIHDDIPTEDILRKRKDYIEEITTFINEYKTFLETMTPKRYFVSKKIIISE